MAEDKKLSDIEKEQVDSKTEEASEVDDAPKEKKKKFGLSLPKFGKKKQNSEKESKEDKVKVPLDPLSPAELVNDLDKDITILEESKDVSMSKVMEEQIEEVKDSDVTITVTKKGFILTMGLVMMILWIVPLSQYALEKLPSLLSQGEEETEETVQESDEFEEISESSQSAKRIRIKDASGSSDEVKALATLLEEGGYEYVEILEDTNFTETKITLITKPDLADQYASVSALVKDQFEIVDSVASLEEDSDFGLVILFP